MSLPLSIMRVSPSLYQHCMPLPLSMMPTERRARDPCLYLHTFHVCMCMCTMKHVQTCNSCLYLHMSHVCMCMCTMAHDAHIQTCISGSSFCWHHRKRERHHVCMCVCTMMCHGVHHDTHVHYLPKSVVPKCVRVHICVITYLESHGCMFVSLIISHVIMCVCTMYLSVPLLQYVCMYVCVFTCM